MDYLQEPTYPTSTPSPYPTTAIAPPSVPPYLGQAPLDDPYNGMPPPAEGEHPSLDALLKHCQQHAGAHGYACVTASNNYRRGIAYVRCDRGGTYVNHWKLTDETRVRKNRTRRLVGCEWKARAKRTETGTWTLTMMNSTHTGHGPSVNATTHPSLRQLPQDAIEVVREAFKAGKSAKEITEIIQKGWNPAILSQDIYNLKAKLAREEKGIVRKGRNYQADAADRKYQAYASQKNKPPLLDPNTDPILQNMVPPPPANMIPLHHTTVNASIVPNVTEVVNGCSCQCCDHSH